MKRALSTILCVILCFMCILSLTMCKSEDTLKASENDSVNERKVKNIIFLIPDGGGYALYDFANDVKISGGLSETLYPNKTPTDEAPMSMRAQHAGSMITLNYQQALTDSAAAGTAMATGKKTENGRIGVDHLKRPRATILEAAQSIGMATGLVSTYEWMHATPASFSAHTMNRSEYDNLYEQIQNQKIDVVLGSGYGAVAQYSDIEEARERGYKIVTNKKALDFVKEGDKLWGDMSNPSSPYDINLEQGQATLAEMTAAAIKALSGDDDGFFLMVEGSKVDTGGHANDALVSTSEYLAFDAAFKVALDFAKGRTDTVVIAAPDHDTGAMDYAGIEDLEKSVSMIMSGKDDDAIGWGTTGHSTQNVGVWMYVPEGVDVIEGLNPVLGDTPENRENYVVDNTALTPYLANLLGVDLDKLTEELFVDVTDYGKFIEMSGKFAFNSGNKHIFKNQSVYYVNGEVKDLDGKVAFMLEDRFYVPKEVVDEKDFEFVNTGDEGITGSGTENDPYVIDDEWDFIEFSSNIELGKDNYEGMYVVQASNLNLANMEDYKGLGGNHTFKGNYDGKGYIIDVNIDSDADRTLFGYVVGNVKNVTVKGSIKCASVAGGIARSVGGTGSIENCACFADVSSEGAFNVGGIAGISLGRISNCYFAGTLSGESKLSPVANVMNDSAVFENCYYSNVEYESELNAVYVTDEQAEGELIDKLNSARADESYFYWHSSKQDGCPELYMPAPVVTGVVVTPAEISVSKNDGYQLSASVVGEYNPSQKVVWSIESSEGEALSIIHDDGFLVVSGEENVSGFTVLAKSAIDGSVTGMCKVMVTDAVETSADGSRARPFVISNEEDFAKLTSDILSGDGKNGLYFVQTADIDMAGFEGYNGLPSSTSFGGIYDGAGHTINLSIDSDGDNSLFGSSRGVIMNVATTGTVKGATRPAGICRAVRDKGVLVNCYSTVDIQGGTEAAGIARSIYHVAANVYYNGNLESEAKYKIGNAADDDDGSTIFNAFCVGEELYRSKDVSELTEQMIHSEELVKLLNDGIKDSAELSGVPASMLCRWTLSKDNCVTFE